MTLTQGNIYSRKKEFHIFTNQDIGLGNFGLNSYTFSSIAHLKDTIAKPPQQVGQLVVINPTKQEFQSYFNGNTDELFEKLLCSGNIVFESSPKIMHFDKGVLRYIEQTASEFLKLTENCQTNVENLPTTIPEFLKAYNESILNTNNDNTSDGFKKTDIIKIAEKIQNSLSGCISFSIKYKALDCDRIVPIKLRLLEKENSDDSRIIASRGSPVIAGIPERMTGGQYSSYGTSNAPMGVYQNPNEGGLDNPRNTVAGQLDLRFNNTTGKWQSGTHQILARLITDVDSAKIGDLNISSSNINMNTVIETYDPNSKSYVGQFAIGTGVPLSMENGNPYTYGPNFIGCSERIQDVEKIRVVNRSNRIFKAGEVVIASEIDGEWIIQGFDLPKTSSAVRSIGAWQFEKFIVNSDHFFNDARYSSSDTLIPKISPNIYETKMRKKYYAQSREIDKCSYSFNNLSATDRSELCRLNFFIDDSISDALSINKTINEEEYDIMLSNKYYQSTIFDQLDPSLGGTNKYGNVIGRTNIYVSPTGSAGDSLGYVYQNNLAHFWGPVFPDGYTSKSVNALKSKKDFRFKLNYNTNTKFLTGGKNPLFDTSKDVVNIGMFSDIKDNNFLQLPSEVGLNGPPNSGLSKSNKFSSPIELISISDSAQNALPYYFYNLVSGANRDRYSYLLVDRSDVTTTTTTQNPVDNPIDENQESSDIFYDLKPINPNIIQFSPLQLHTALSPFTITSNILDWILLDRQLEDSKGTDFFKQNYSNKTDLFFGESVFGTDSVTNSILPPTFYNITGPFNFGPFLTKSPSSSIPLGGPGIIPKGDLIDEKSGVVGIIAAKNTFSGNNINFTVKQDFGLPKKITVGGGGGISVTALGPFIGWSQNTGAGVTSRGTPQWGDRSRTDNIDSFGTTSLHVRIFDEWPDNQTFFDGRYFSVLHFNPTHATTSVDTGEVLDSDTQRLNCIYGDKIESIERNENTVLIVKFRDGTIKHIAETNVDFTEPTLANGTVVSLRQGINYQTPLLEPEFWHINPIRRGALLTGGGFRYRKKVIGLAYGSIRFKNNINGQPMRGNSYKENDIINFPGGARIKVTAVDPDNGQIIYYELIDKGTGYLPKDFDPYKPISTTGGGSGSGAVLECTGGQVYYVYDIDLGPQERCPITRLTSSSNMGEKEVKQDQKTTITLDGDGRYDAFYFMHNDILHTLTLDTPFTAGFAQYITLEIT